MQRKHKIFNLPYAAIVDIVGTKTELRTPTEGVLQQPLPGIRTQTAICCTLGHLSISVQAITRRSCVTANCNAGDVYSVTVQKIGQKVYKILDAELQSPNIPQLDNLSAFTLLDLQSSSITSVTSTRSANYMDRLIASMDSVFCPTVWTLDYVKVILLRYC